MSTRRTLDSSSVRWWRSLQIFIVAPSLALSAGCERDSAQTLDAGAGVPVQTIDAGDGVPIVYESFGEGGTTVVFVHCWTCSRAQWRHQIEPVAEAGYRVVTLDLPGHGDSGAQREDWSINGLAADVATVIDGLGLSNVILVGHSMGAHVSLLTTQRLPGRVTGVGCVDMLHDVEFEWPEDFAGQFVDSLRADYRRTLEFFFPQLLPPDADPELVEWVMNQTFTADQVAVTELMADLVTLDDAALLEGAGVPVRCINAAPFSEMSVPTAVETNRRYADFDAVEMHGVGHFPHLEQPEAFNGYLLRMLAELSR